MTKIDDRIELTESDVWTIVNSLGMYCEISHVRQVMYELNLRMIHALRLPWCACEGGIHVHKTGSYLDWTDTWRELCGCTEASVLDDNHNVCTLSLEG